MPETLRLRFSTVSTERTVNTGRKHRSFKASADESSPHYYDVGVGTRSRHSEGNVANKQPSALTCTLGGSAAPRDRGRGPVGQWGIEGSEAVYTAVRVGVASRVRAIRGSDGLSLPARGSRVVVSLILGWNA